MLTVLQRVSQAGITVNETNIAQINQGLVILCGFEKEDNEQTLKKMLDKCVNYRVFSDAEGKMNLSLRDINGDLLLVPQFTLIAETKRGLRPSFSIGASPKAGEALFASLINLAHQYHTNIQAGQFGKDMKVSLCNDGPATFILKF